MKKFHFYLVNVEPINILNGNCVGSYIRDGDLQWNKKATKGYDNVVKVTLWLSQKPLKCIQRAKISGRVYLEDDNDSPLAYSHRRIISAILKANCLAGMGYSPILQRKNAARWFARAKVEKV